MSYYCDGCHADDPFACGTFLADYERARARAARHYGRKWTAVQNDALAAELEECGCTCACHEPAVDQPARVSAGGRA